MDARVRALAAQPPAWRLDDLYEGRDDARIEADLAAAGAHMAELAMLQDALADARSEPLRLGRLIERGALRAEAASEALSTVSAFAALSAAAARDDEAWSRFESDMRARTARIWEGALAFTAALNALDEVRIEAALDAHPPARRWRPWLRRLRAMRPHELDIELERMLLDRAPALAGWTRLYDETLARLTVRAGPERLGLAEALERLAEPDPARRRSAAQGLSRALEAESASLALSFNTLALEKRTEDRWRRLEAPAAARHLANEIDAEAVAALEAAVVASYPRLSHRYYALKAKSLGRQRLRHWDRAAPLSSVRPRAYGWTTAKATVLEGFEALSPRLASVARRLFEGRFVDAAPRPGKQAGAFCHPGAGRHPYVFLNFRGERRDVLTLAHEVGHAVHQSLAAPQGPLLADIPLTLAETAAMVAEGLTLERLEAASPRRERRSLLAARIEDALGAVTRQIALHRFETRFHEARADGELSPAQIGALWLEAMGESLGPAVRLDDGYETYWALIGHFVHAPFYAYSYAFGGLLAEAMLDRRRADPKGFAALYEDFLAAGGARTYVEALAPFGLDARDPALWTAGCARLERLVDEFEILA